MGMVPTCATCQGYGSQLLLIHSKKPHGPRVQTGQPEVVVAVSHIQRINYFTRWPIPLVVCWTGNREQKRKSGSPPPSPPLPSPRCSFGENQIKSRDASTWHGRYAGLVPSRVRTKIPSVRRLGQWVSLRKILRFRVQ